MTKLPTCGMLSITDGRLMDDIGQVYTVVSYFIGRSAFTHELPMYADKIAPVIVEAFPKLSGAPERDWQDVKKDAIAEYGNEIEVSDEWAGMFHDGKNALATLPEAIKQERENR